MGEGSILEETIDDGKQANIIRSSDNLKERLDEVKQEHLHIRDENEVEPNDEEHEEEPEICKCCGQIIK